MGIASYNILEEFQLFSSGAKGTVAYWAHGGLTYPLPSAHSLSENEGLNFPIKCPSLNWGISLNWQAVSVSGKTKQIVLSICGVD